MTTTGEHSGRYPSPVERKQIPGNHHPFRQIAESPSHRLLLKQWLKEEDLIAHRVALRESRLDAVRKEITVLFCAFFSFHSVSLLLLYSSVSSPAVRGGGGEACRRSWIPCLCSFILSLAVAWAVRYKTDTEAVLERMAEREREDGVLLGKCMEELKRKGAEFDLLKEVDALRRAKSLRGGDAKWPPGAGKVRRWSGRDHATLIVLALGCGVVGLTRFVLCS